MTAPTAITPDVLTLPRKAPVGADGRINVVGLPRMALQQALIDAGTPERQVKMRLGKIWQWIYHWGVRDFSAMTNLAKEYRSLLETHFVI